MIKRIALLILIAIPLSALSQRFLVKFAAGSLDVPDGWPIETSNPVGFTNVIAGWSTNWTSEELESRKNSLQSAYDAIQDAKRMTIETNRLAKLKMLADLFADFQGYEDGWSIGTNYTAAQMQVILRKHNGAFLLLKPLLKDLYDGRQ